MFLNFFLKAKEFRNSDLRLLPKLTDQAKHSSDFLGSVYKLEIVDP